PPRRHPAGRARRVRRRDRPPGHRAHQPMNHHPPRHTREAATVSDFDVKVLSTDDYPLIITVDKNSVAEVHGRIPAATVVEVLRHLTGHFEQQATTTG
ncbi:hypothetical protein ACWC5I_47105, partial [Kitasatospora sp. NPDC001574]